MMLSQESNEREDLRVGSDGHVRFFPGNGEPFRKGRAL